MNILKRLRDKDSRRGLWLISPTLLWMIGLLIIPLILVVITSLGQRDPDGNVIYTFSVNNYLRLMGYSFNASCGDTPPPCFDDLYITILWRSLVLAFQTTALVILVGYPLAYYVARAPARWRNLLLFLILIPLWTNFVIRVYAWIMILRSQGVINNLLEAVWPVILPVYTVLYNLILSPLSVYLPLHLSAPGAFQPLEMLYTPGAVLVGMLYEFLPFMILPMYTSLEKIEPALYEAAADLGASAARTFWRVTLPLSAPGIVAGTILVFIPVMGTFIVSDILGGRQVILVGNLIQRQFLDARDSTFGSAASIILMVMTLIVTIFYTRRFGFGEEIASA
ncbi:MAG: ABC transporter permease [Chloroflexi bacterium RBG_16_63_12]|nr:MAG: ABC transporter permease [Chloroflexi bacterium RBG_16_63_12]